MIQHAEDMIDRVKKLGVKHQLCVAGADDPDIIQIADEARKKGVVDSTLVGSKDKILKIANDLSIDPDHFNIVDKPDPEEGVKEAVRLIETGACDILMKGRVRTADLMGRMLEDEHNLRTDRIVSHVAAFTVPGEDRMMLITDAGINIAPSLKWKRDIILNAVDVAHSVGIECPRVAVLSFIEKTENKDIHPGIRASTEDAEKLAQMNKDGLIPGCVVEGPYALDNAISMYAAEKKGIHGEVAGRADILVAHDINMGNAIYKSLQVWVRAVMASVVVGFKIPVVLPSRTDSRESKLQSIGLAIHLGEPTSSRGI